MTTTNNTAAQVGDLPEGFRYPDKPAPRAWGYLDDSGVPWAGYDTGQMEEYARVSYSAGFGDGLDAVMTPAYRGCTVSEAMIDAAIEAYNGTYKAGQREWMRDALTAALAQAVQS